MTHRRQDRVGGTEADGQPAQVQGEVASDSHRPALGQGDLQKPAAGPSSPRRSAGR